jgi:hypothetical protein
MFLMSLFKGAGVKMKELCCRLYVGTSFWLQRHAAVLLFLLGLVLLHCGLTGAAQAQTGGQVFGTSACNLLGQVLEKNFGAMITVITGALAILAAIVGSFKGAWALVFVSVGCFICEELIQILFPGLQC